MWEPGLNIRVMDCKISDWLPGYIKANLPTDYERKQCRKQWHKSQITILHQNKMKINVFVWIYTYLLCFFSGITFIPHLEPRCPRFNRRRFIIQAVWIHAWNGDPVCLGHLHLSKSRTSLKLYMLFSYLVPSHSSDGSTITFQAWTSIPRIYFSSKILHERALQSCRTLLCYSDPYKSHFMRRSSCVDQSVFSICPMS